MATTKIKITDDSQGRTFRTGVNGRFYDLRVNEEIEVDADLIPHLESIGASFDKSDDANGARSSKEGSGEGLAPIGPHDVRAPAMDAKSLGDRRLAGDQPGDVTKSGGVSFGVGGRESIKDAAEISDIRVAAERATSNEAPPAEKAGEGEAGTEKAETQGVEPTHQETDQEKQDAKARKSAGTARKTKAKSADAKASEGAGTAKVNKDEKAGGFFSRR